MLVHSSQMSGIFHRTMMFPFTNGVHSNVTFPDSEQDDANKFVINRRRSLSVPSDTQFMMAFAWTVPMEKLMFELFSSIIYVDTTADTNNEGRPLLTMAGKDTSSRLFPIIRAFLPNQQMWTFRWVFSVLLPRAYSKRILSKVQIIITDGDSQETNQLDNALSLYFPQARRVQCGWHIVNRSWNSNIEGPTSFPKNMRPLYDCIRNICHTWIYSFMTSSNCETFEEYVLSKHLFLRFIGNPRVSDGIGGTLSAHIQTWFKNYVEPHEQQFCFYLRKNLLHFGEYSNSAAEGGIHSNIKNCTAPVRPSHTLHRSMAILTKNAVREAKQKNAKRYKDINSSRTYCIGDQFNEVIDQAFVHLESCCNIAYKYKCIRCSESEFLVTRNLQMYPYESVVHIPRFVRVRKVSLRYGKIVCDCTMRKTFGLVCPHVVHVKRMCDETFSPSFRDISCIWWKVYSAVSEFPESEKYLRWFRLLKNREIVGIEITLEEIAHIPIHEGVLPPCFVYDKKHPKCVNYPPSMCNMRQVFSGGPGNMRIIQTMTMDSDSLSLESDSLSFNVTNNTDNDSLCDTVDDSNNNEDSSLRNATGDDYNDFFQRLLEQDNDVQCKGNPLANPYGYLKMSFCEMTEIMKGNATLEELKDVKQYLDNVTHELMGRVGSENRNVRNPESEYVSSNVNFKKRFKSHGTGFV